MMSTARRHGIGVAFELVWLSRLDLVRQTALNSAGSGAVCDVEAAADLFGLLVMCQARCINHCNSFFIQQGLRLFY